MTSNLESGKVLRVVWKKQNKTFFLAFHPNPRTVCNRDPVVLTTIFNKGFVVLDLGFFARSSLCNLFVEPLSLVLNCEYFAPSRALSLLSYQDLSKISSF